MTTLPNARGLIDNLNKHIKKAVSRLNLYFFFFRWSLCW